MGVCGSKEQPQQFAKVEKRLGTSINKDQSSSSRPAPKPSRKPEVAGQGHKLGSSKPTTRDTEDSVDAKQLAAKAAQDRFSTNKKKNEAGELGKRLAKEKKKGMRDYGMEDYEKDKLKRNELVYD